MKLFGMAVSPYVSRALLVAELKGVELPLVPPQIDTALAKMVERMAVLANDPAASLDRVLFMEGTPFMRDVNPAGRMPALEVDGRFLGESLVICEFLDERFPEPPLLPADAIDRAEVRRLCLMSDLYLMARLWPLAWQIDPRTRNDGELQRIKEQIAQDLHELEQAMGPGPWAHGNAVSLADCALVYSVLFYQGVLTTTTENLGMTAFDPDRPFPDHPRLRQWWSHLESDPVFEGAIERYRQHYAALFRERLVSDRSPVTYVNWLKARCPR